MIFQDLAREFVQKMHSLQKARMVANLDLSLQGEQFVLFFISDSQNNQGVTPGDISAAVGLSTARVAATLNSLESKQLITREIDPNDRRQIIVRLTQKGREYTDCRVYNHIGQIAKMLAALGENDAKEYVRITDRIAQIMLTLDPIDQLDI